MRFSGALDRLPSTSLRFQACIEPDGLSLTGNMFPTEAVVRLQTFHGFFTNKDYDEGSYQTIFDTITQSSFPALQHCTLRLPLLLTVDMGYNGVTEQDISPIILPGDNAPFLRTPSRTPQQCSKMFLVLLTNLQLYMCPIPLDDIIAVLSFFSA